MEEPGGLQSMGSLRVGRDWWTSLSLSCIGEGNGNPLQCSCLEIVPGMGKPGGLPSMGSHRVRHDWNDLAAAAAAAAGLVSATQFWVYYLVFNNPPIHCCCSVTKSCSIFHNPVDYYKPGSSVLHYLSDFAQIHVHWVHNVTATPPLLLRF